MPTRDELPARTDSWATRFDTEEALAAAEDALRAAALKEHDLAGLLHLGRHRPLTPDQWHALTYVRFPDHRELTVFLAQVYAYLFEDFEATPLVPQ